MQLLATSDFDKHSGILQGAIVPFLSLHSPDLSPIERFWMIIMAQWFTDFVTKDRNAPIARLGKALTWAVSRREASRQTCFIRQTIQRNALVVLRQHFLAGLEVFGDHNPVVFFTQGSISHISQRIIPDGDDLKELSLFSCLVRLVTIN